MKNLQHFPLHPLFLCIFPVLSLLATNITEVDPDVILRPLLFSIAGMILILVTLRMALKDIRKAAMVASLFLVLFFSYGHVYQILELKEIFGVNIGRHRYLIPFYILIACSGLWFILRKIKDFVSITIAMNIIGGILLITPIVQIVSFNIKISAGVNAISEMRERTQASELKPPDDLPDIYYIILDTYTRADALQRDLNFDNSAFLNGLKELGFYVADCSRSNYSYTQASITTALNLEYLPDLRDDLEELGLGSGDIWVLLKQSLVRRNLEELGYQTVAFETGYEWSRLQDADFYFGNTPLDTQKVSPFEAMFVKSTALIVLVESPNWWMMEQMNAINFPYGEYVQAQKSILNKLPKISAMDGAKFVFAHILIPHVPYVFDPQGNIREDSGFYGGKLAEPVNESYLVEGYTGEIQFINSKMLEITEQIINESRVPPIIIIHGDHGLRDENRLQILNVYYLPNGGALALYPSVSPVNSFRIVFDTYFGTDYGLLNDESFYGDDIHNPIPEYSPECQ
jgi:hypothetical protein